LAIGLDGVKIPVLFFSPLRFLLTTFEKTKEIMDTEQKDLSQFTLTEDRHDQGRKHQVIFSGHMDSDLEIVASKEIQLLEGLEARLHQNLNNVIEIVRKFAVRAPSK
jgi:hypothetical protein